MEEEKKQKVINIYPTKNTRRILVFFSDLLMLFISCVFIFEMIVNPIVKVSTDFDTKVNTADTYSRTRNQILYDNDILFFEEETKYSFSTNLRYTADQFLKYYVFDSENINNEVVVHYFKDIRDVEVNKINEIYLKYGEKYFNQEEYTSLGTYAFKEEYIDLLSPYFREGDELSSEGETTLTSFREFFFLNVYSEVIKDIIDKDLSSSNPSIAYSYNELSDKISEFDTYYKNITTLGSYITFFLGASILFFLVPLLNKKGRTFSEMILKVERVDKKEITYLKKRFVVVEGLINTLNGLLILFVIPVISFEFSKVFTLNLLFSVSFVSLIFIVIELIIMLINQYGRSIKELATNSICCDTETIDNYYRERGYDV